MVKIRLGTRGSRLALKQVSLISSKFERLGFEVEPVVISTKGDRGDREALGSFVVDIADAVRKGEVDAGLHCLKDLPTQADQDLRLLYCDAADSFEYAVTISGNLKDLVPGSVIGTGSLRRTAQLKAVYPQFEYRPIVGNVDTRLAKLESGEYDALILAAAGMMRLALQGSYCCERISERIVMPCAGQGVLVLQVKQDFHDLDTMNNRAIEVGAVAERAFLHEFGSGCRLPVAAMAGADLQGLVLYGRVVAPDGSKVLDGEDRLPINKAAELGVRLAQKLIDQGALELIGGSL